MRMLAGLIIVLVGMTGGPLLANDPPTFPDFTFKRVKPPAPGTKRRITVQIEPAPIVEKQVAVAASPKTPTVPAETSKKSAFGWFWDKVPTNGMGPPGADAAIAMLGQAPSGQAVRAPRLNALRKIVENHGREILAATVGTRVSPALVLAVISTESGGRVNVTSHAGAQGLMQLMPATAARFGVTNSMSARQNIQGGVKYLDWLMGEFNNDPVLVLAGYNAGEGAVRKYAGVPPYAETRGYVPKVMAAFQVARGLCLTPPMLVSDGCVFVGGRSAQNG